MPIEFRCGALASRAVSLCMRTGLLALPMGRLTCHFEYAEELFDHLRIQRMASDYASVLATLAFDAHAYVGEVLVCASHDREPVTAEYTISEA